MGYERTKYLAKNTIIFAIGNVGTKLINFLMVPLYSYVLSTDEYGSIDLIFTVLSVVIPVISLNICESVQRFSLDNNADYISIFTNCAAITLIGAALSIVIIPLGCYFLHNSELTVLIYGYIVFYSLYMLIACFLRGKEELIKYTFCNVLLSVSICVLNLFFLVYLKSGIKGYLAAYCISYMFVSIIGFIIGEQWRYVHFSFISRNFSRKMVSFSIALVPNSLLWWIVNSSDRIMVSGKCGVSENGLYAMAYKLPSLLSVLSTIFMQAWGFSAIRESDNNEGINYQNKVFQQLIGIMSLIAVAMLLLLKPLVKFLLSDNYYDSWKYSPFLVIGFVFVSLASFTGTVYYVTKDSKRQMYSALGGAIVNVFLNFCLIPFLGALGVSIATCISYLMIFLFRLIDTRKDVTYHFFESKNIVTMLCLVLSVAFVYINNIYLSEGLLLIMFMTMMILHGNILFQMITFFFKMIKERSKE